MFDVPAMLMVGSPWKNSGKTELVCTLIRAFSPQLDVVGIKVTPISLHGEGFSHDGEPSPVVSARDDTYRLAEERESSRGTDTSRMLASGAKRAFWLRAREEHLESGFTSLLGIIGEQAAMICESNTLCRFVKPGVFLMIVPNVVHEVKPSFRDLVDLADRIVHSDGSIFDIAPGDIRFHGGRWSIGDASRTSE